MRFTRPYVGSYDSTLLQCELRFDSDVYFKTEEMHLGVTGYHIDDFNCWDLTNMNNGKDLSHILNDKELWPCIKSEIMNYLDSQCHYLVDDEAW